MYYFEYLMPRYNDIGHTYIIKPWIYVTNLVFNQHFPAIEVNNVAGLEVYHNGVVGFFIKIVNKADFRDFIIIILSLNLMGSLFFIYRLYRLVLSGIDLIDYILLINTDYYGKNKFTDSLIIKFLKNSEILKLVNSEEMHRVEASLMTSESPESSVVEEIVTETVSVADNFTSYESMIMLSVIALVMIFNNFFDHYNGTDVKNDEAISAGYYVVSEPLFNMLFSIFFGDDIDLESETQKKADTNLEISKKNSPVKKE